MAEIKLFDTDEKISVAEPSKPKVNYSAIQEKAKTKLLNANTDYSPYEQNRDLFVDVGTGAAIGAALAGLKGKKDADNAINLLKKGKETPQGYQKKIIKRGQSNDKEIVSMMEQNKQAAKDVASGGDFKKALTTILTNSKREAEIGPRFQDDIAKILEKDTGLSEREVNKAIKKWQKENEGANNLITLIEAKDPDVTFGHSLRVAETTAQIARHAGMSEAKVKRLANAALIHDIGKIQVPDSIINSSFDKNKYPELFRWMITHDIVGKDILEVSPFKSKIAGSHHNSFKKNGSNQEKWVTLADIYDAIVSPRSYKPQHSKDFTLNNEGGMAKNVKYGSISQDYLDFLKGMSQVLNEYYDVDSEIKDAYKSMKANGIKKPIYGELVSGNAVGGALAGGSAALMLDVLERELQKGSQKMPDKGGLESTNLPTASDLAGAISPTYRKRGDKLNDIKKWYERGYSNADLEMKILTTDFNNNKQVTELWKVWKDFIDNQK